MYPRLLVTPSLINSWLWYMNCWEESEESAKADFLTTLRREKTEPNEAMLAGIKFELDIQHACYTSAPFTSDDDLYDTCVNEFADIVRGGAWQVKTMKEIEVERQPFLAYGRVDVLKGPNIYDIKFTKSYKDGGKYWHSAQTSMYLEMIDGQLRIVYLCSDGRNTYKDEYRREDAPAMSVVIGEFWNWLPPDMREIYTEMWRARGDG